MTDLERQQACTHETACWLSPDFRLMRYSCNQCGKQVESLAELVKDAHQRVSRNLQWKLAQRLLSGQV